MLGQLDWASNQDRAVSQWQAAVGHPVPDAAIGHPVLDAVVRHLVLDAAATTSSSNVTGLPQKRLQYDTFPLHAFPIHRD